jgi:hypothetical protein
MSVLEETIFKPIEVDFSLDFISQETCRLVNEIFGKVIGLRLATLQNIVFKEMGERMSPDQQKYFRLSAFDHVVMQGIRQGKLKIVGPDISRV